MRWLDSACPAADRVLLPRLALVHVSETISFRRSCVKGLPQTQPGRFGNLSRQPQPQPRPPRLPGLTLTGEPGHRGSLLWLVATRHGLESLLSLDRGPDGVFRGRIDPRSACRSETSPAGRHCQREQAHHVNTSEPPTPWDLERAIKDCQTALHPGGEGGRPRRSETTIGTACQQVGPRTAVALFKGK